MSMLGTTIFTSNVERDDGLNMQPGALVFVAAGVTVGVGTGFYMDGNNTFEIEGTLAGATPIQIGASNVEVHIAQGALLWGGTVAIELLNAIGSVPVSNDGTISSPEAIKLHTTEALTLLNTGTIESFNLPPNPLLGLISNDGTSSTLTITNSGLIESLSGQAAISGGGGVDSVTNTGRIVGAIALGGGADLYDGHLGHHTGGVIDGGAGADRIFGGAEADSIAGGADSDLIRGGAGKDSLDGGASTDTVDYTDKTQKVQVTLDGTTASNVLVNGVVEDSIKGFEDVNGGSAGDVLTGDINNNLLLGLGGNDSLHGGIGLDTLVGGAGDDLLTGGFGADHFRFDTTLGATNIDTITDFVSGTDKLELKKAVFGNPAGTALAVGAFYAAAGVNHGHEADDRIVYDTASGKLYYDLDGSGAHVAIEFAVLTAHPVLGAGDFVFI